MRDDALNLYGFATEEERDLFLLLIGVQNVGPKVALAVLSGGSPRELASALATGTPRACRPRPGIGKRTAERIVVELRQKFGARRGPDHDHPRRGDDPRTLARDGLLELGFTPQEADGLLEARPGNGPRTSSPTRSRPRPRRGRR